MYQPESSHSLVAGMIFNFSVTSSGTEISSISFVEANSVIPELGYPEERKAASAVPFLIPSIPSEKVETVHENSEC